MRPVWLICSEPATGPPSRAKCPLASRRCTFSRVSFGAAAPLAKRSATRSRAPESVITFTRTSTRRLPSVRPARCACCCSTMPTTATYCANSFSSTPFMPCAPACARLRVSCARYLRAPACVGAHVGELILAAWLLGFVERGEELFRMKCLVVACAWLSRSHKVGGGAIRVPVPVRGRELGRQVPRGVSQVASLGE